jgi:hypothetical protein
MDQNEGDIDNLVEIVPDRSDQPPNEVCRRGDCLAF